jgi:uncharacterized protein YcbK (DUF882 family)
MPTIDLKLKEINVKTDIQLTKHFHLNEFLHPGCEKIINVPLIENLRKLANRLEEARKLLGNRPITITSGLRTPEHNREVGGASKSEHLYGKAADIVVPGLKASEVQRILKDWEGGLGSYSSWTHVDTGAKRRWNG